MFDYFLFTQVELSKIHFSDFSRLPWPLNVVQYHCLFFHAFGRSVICGCCIISPNKRQLKVDLFEFDFGKASLMEHAKVSFSSKVTINKQHLMEAKHRKGATGKRFKVFLHEAEL